MTDIQKMLFDLRDEEYRDFNSKLLPTVEKETIIGVRTPQLRKLAKELWKDSDGREFIKVLPHKYYEENNLHSFFIEMIKDYDEVLIELDKFLPFVDNWATCDSMKPKILGKFPEKTKAKAIDWIKTGDVYTVRYGIGVLMNYFLDENFSADILRIVAEIKSEEYYINMMIAWFFATALAKQYDSAVKYIENNSLDKWVHNKTIQKAVESYRITDTIKSYLRKQKSNYK